MLQAGRFVIFIVRINEPEPGKKAARRHVFGIVSCENCTGTSDRKGMLDHAGTRFERVTLLPMPAYDVNSEFGNIRLSCAAPQATAAYVLSSRKQEERPVLDAVGALFLDLQLESDLHFARRVAARCDGCIAAHVNAALKAGASREEIGETLIVAVSMGGGPSLVYATRALEAVEELSKS